MTDSKKKITINIEAIKTPLGPVPTLESLKKIVEALNILNADMIRTQETVNSEVFKQMAGIEKELKSLRKLISEEIISFGAIKEGIEKLISEEIVSFGAIKEDITGLNKRLDKMEVAQNNKIKELSDLITDFIGSVRVFQDQVARLLKKG